MDYAESLWAKAKLFMNRAMDTVPERPFDERALWASLSLELLAKSALAWTSPVLVADPQKSDGRHVLAAAGLLELEADFQTVSTHTVFSRCAHAFKPFSESRAKLISNARNDYIHSRAVPFTKIPESRWWSDIWSQASILILAQEKSIEDFVGFERAHIAKFHVEQNKKHVEQTAEILVARAKGRFEKRQSGTISHKQFSNWLSEAQLSLGLPYSSAETCPACGLMGWVEAEDVENIRMENPEWYHQVVHPSEDYGQAEADAIGVYFSCAHCQLVLHEYELLEAAGVEPVFTVEDDSFLEWLHQAEYGND